MDTQNTNPRADWEVSTEDQLSEAELTTISGGNPGPIGPPDKDDSNNNAGGVPTPTPQPLPIGGPLPTDK